MDEQDEPVYATYEEAAAAARAAEAAYAAAIPWYMQAIADQFSAGLPDGLRFEWR